MNTTFEEVKDDSPDYTDLGKKLKLMMVEFAAEYAYRKANPSSTMNVPSIVYEDAERFYDRWVVEQQKKSMAKILDKK